jgi:hypothetical protein
MAHGFDIVAVWVLNERAVVIGMVLWSQTRRAVVLARRQAERQRRTLSRRRGPSDNIRTVVTDRDQYGPGLHRYNRTFLDFAHHYGFLPRLCRPYRAKTKGKVERFIGYLRKGFYIPLASQFRPEGLKVDRDTANVRVATWLREVANVRVHATTGEVPLVRLELERERLQPMARPWPGVIQRARGKLPTPAPLGYQHSLKVYEELIAAGAG